MRIQTLDHMGGKDDVGMALLKSVGDFHSDLVVMGGYRHSRLHNVIMGSTTEYVLKHTKLPILMSH